MQPYITIDIETKGGRPEDAERDMRINWSPAANWKPETIGNRYLEMLAKKKERLALIDGSGIISIALRGGSLVCFHSMFEQPQTVLDGAVVAGFKTECEMLIALREYFAATTDEHTCLVGHNIKEFDLPKLRMAYARHGLCLPPCLTGDQPVYDLMKEWGYRFSATRDPYVGLADIYEVLGRPIHKGMIDGSQIEDLYASNQHELIIKYNLLDAHYEHELFLSMTGQKPDLEVGAAPEPAPAYATELPTEGDTAEPAGAAATATATATEKKSRRKLE